MAIDLGGRFYGEDELQGLGFKELGRNVRIHDRASIYGVENISIGDNVRIDDFTVIIATGPMVIGSFIQVCNFCFLGATNGITLGDFVTLAPGVKIFSSSDDYSGKCLANPMVPVEFSGGQSGPVTLGRHVILGAGTVVMPNIILAEGCSVGALSLVNRSLDGWGIYGGVPARRLKERKRDLLHLERQLLGKKQT